MTTLRVLHTCYPHWGQHSGIHQYLRYLDQKRFKVELAGVSDSDGDFPVTNRRIQEWMRGKLHGKGMPWYKLSDFAAEFKAFVQCGYRSIDIIHYLDGEHTARFLPRLSSVPRSLRPALIATYHQPADLLDSLVAKPIIRRLDAITLVSSEQVSFFLELLPPEKVYVILHGIDTAFFKPSGMARSNGQFNCITVGHYHRDFSAVFDVATRLRAERDIHFHVVSPKPSGLEGMPNVTIYKGIDDAKLLRLYQEAQLLFLPVIQSTANNALLEGIACGLPVLSTDLPSVRAYLPGEEAILIKDNHRSDLTDALLSLKRDRAERQRRAIAARKRAEELDWHNIAPQYEALYRSVMGLNFCPHAAAGPAARERL
jgi:glycosyltransferase involved in cell wall biosynthesis